MKVRVINGSEIFWVEGDFTTYGEFKNILVTTHNMSLDRQSISMRQLFGDTKPVFRAKKEGTTTAEDRVAPSYVLPTNLGKKADTGEITHDFTVVIAEVENKLGAYSHNTIKELRSKMRNLFNQARETGVNQPLVNSTEHLVETVFNELISESTDSLGMLPSHTIVETHSNGDIVLSNGIILPVESSLTEQEIEDLEEDDCEDFEDDDDNDEEEDYDDEYSDEDDEETFEDDEEEDESFEEKDEEVDESF